MESPINQSLLGSSSSTKFTKDQRIFLILFALNSFMSFMIYSLAGPLYPPEATAHGLNPSKYGIIMSLTCGTMAILSLFITQIEISGLRLSYASSTFFGGSAAILMGSLHYFTSYWIFVTVSVIAFILNGVAFAVSVSSSYLLCLSVFPARTAIAVGVIEGGYLSATCFGPIMCEVVFTYFGYSTTYFIFGSVLFSMSIFIFVTLPPIPLSSTYIPTFRETVQGYVDLAKFPSVLIFTAALIVLELGNDFLTSILEPGLRPFSLTRIGVGLMFLSNGLPQLLGPFWGFILEKFKRPEIFLVMSLFVMAGATIILREFIEVNHAGTAVGLALYGLGQGMTDLGVVVNFQQEVKEKRAGEAAAVNFSFVASVYTFMTGVGGLLGPSIAGILFETYGFGNAMLFVCTTHSIMGVIIVVFMLRMKCKPRSIHSDYETLESSDD